ncbi:FliM/FliN family flagellar motor switch protein [Endozoicomonas lisbonensis]|uniref:Flagellar motor switch protein FliM n=1 Tax=Endozoicomonas lisbonensis TaxID=3120522 RepID=A0ABV2SIQ4_9GAMM
MTPVTPYDLHLAGNSLQKYERIFSRAVNSCGTMLERDLAEFTQSLVQVEASSIVEWKSLNEDSDKLCFKSWASINNYKNAYCLIVIQKQLFKTLIEKIFGGRLDKSFSQDEARQPTSAEWRLYGRIVNLLLSHMKESMSSVGEFNIEMLRDAREASDAYRIHNKKTDHIASDIFQVNIDGASGFIKIEYPTMVLKQAIERSSKKNNAESMADQLKRSLSFVPLVLTASIAMDQISLEKLLSMNEGDFLPFPDTSATVVSVAGKPFYTADIMIQDNEQLAAVISEPNR